MLTSTQDGFDVSAAALNVIKGSLAATDSHLRIEQFCS
jgi:hypothetical protein